MATTLLIKVWNVSLFRADGEFVDETQVDEKKDDLANDLFYDDFGNDKEEGDYLEWTEGTEKILEGEYIAAELQNEIIKTLEE